MALSDVLQLSLVWIAWCALHSLMITKTALIFCETNFPRFCLYHRLIFNIISVVTFLLAYQFTRIIPTNELYRFDGSENIIRIGLVIVAILLFIGGAIGYDMFHFAGIRQLINKSGHRVLTKSGSFKADGLMKAVRHPWYLAGMILIWTGNRIMTGTDLTINIIFTSYFIIGTLQEERKLIWQFGEQYQQYQREVSMFLPFKWIRWQLKKLFRE